MKRSFIQAYLEEIGQNSNSSCADTYSSSVPSAPHSPLGSSFLMPASDTSQHGEETSDEHENHQPEGLPVQAPSSKRQRIDFSSVTNSSAETTAMPQSTVSNSTVAAAELQPSSSSRYHHDASTTYTSNVARSTSSSVSRRTSVTTASYHQFQPSALYIPKQQDGAEAMHQQQHQAQVRHYVVASSSHRRNSTTPSTPKLSTRQQQGAEANTTSASIHLPSFSSVATAAATNSLSDHMPVITIGDTKVIADRVIATGSYGVVYKAMYGIYKVAVKMMKLVSEESFLRECECLVQSVDCDYTLNILGFGELLTPSRTGGGQLKEFFIVTEYCGNRTLRTLLSPSTYPEFQWQEKQRIMLEMLESVSQIHRHEVCHHDIKPENIIISSEGSHVKIADFGFASFEAGEYRKSGKGTPAYAAPEAFTNEMDFASDIWSLGICFHELLTGRIPPPEFWKLTNGDMSALRQELEQCQVPAVWQQVILDDMLNIDPKNRLECTKIIHKLVSAGITVFEESKNRINFLSKMKQEVVSNWTKKKAITGSPRLIPTTTTTLPPPPQPTGDMAPTAVDLKEVDEDVESRSPHHHQHPVADAMMPPLPSTSTQVSLINATINEQSSKAEVMLPEVTDIPLSKSVVAQIASSSPIGGALLQDILCNSINQKTRPMLCTKRSSFSK